MDKELRIGPIKTHKSRKFTVSYRKWKPKTRASFLQLHFVSYYEAHLLRHTSKITSSCTRYYVLHAKYNLRGIRSGLVCRRSYILYETLVDPMIHPVSENKSLNRIRR